MSPTVTSTVKAKKSCQHCPSFLAPQDQNKIFGTNVGGAVCGQRLIAIGRPGQATDTPINQLVAEKCDRFNSPSPSYDLTAARTEPISLSVAMPRIVDDKDIQSSESVVSCRDCMFYVSPTEVRSRVGWNSSYCAARGELILEDRLGTYPKTCSSKSYGNYSIYANVLNLLPEFQDGFGKRKLTDILTNRSTDPQEIETQAPVTQKQRERGIRAWRLIQDPEGFGPDVKLPIFDLNYFDKIEGSKIPKIGDQERPEDYVDHGGFVYKAAALWMELDETPVVWGEPGVGKTELYRHLAFLMQLPFVRISITGASEIDDLAGKPGYSPERGTFFTYGRLPQAWIKPNVVCVDEPNSGPPEVWMLFRPLTDNSKQFVLDQNNGERLDRHLNCYLGMAMNPAWDPRNSGVMSLADADGSRLMHLMMGLPPADIEKQIIMKALERDGWELDDASRVAAAVISCAKDLRSLSNEGTISVSWGLRPQLKVAKAMRFFSPLAAYRIGVADSLAPQERDAIMDVVKSKFEE